ncbi:hypothetical protein BCEN4_2110007 [Burkholderia cenocepacia]|nr:hypothetical protein BCEN4_2110007 [Burkholderia cenocepacia]
MRSSTAVARLPHGTATAPARGARGGREIGKARPSTLALRREHDPDHSDYPCDAQETRGSSHCL